MIGIKNRIKELRKEYGYTQEGLAQALGLSSKSSIANYENGANYPSDDIKIKMCDIFNCTMDYLMGNSEYKNEKIYNESLLKSYSIDKYVFTAFDTLLSCNLPTKTITLVINNFNYYCKYIINQLTLYNKGGYISENKNIKNFTDTQNEKFFFIFHDNLIKLLVDTNSIEINKFDKKPLFLPNAFNYTINNSAINKIISLITLYIDILNAIFKQYKTSIDSVNLRLFNIPILGKIAAGQPILAEQYIEGYLPMDPNIYGMKTPDDYFYLRVAGESMNLKIHNGDYALIHKQDSAEDGDIVVAIVNGDDEATLKKYKRISDDTVALEPMSTLPMEPIYINLKETNFKIIGKAIGQFGKF